MKSSGINKSKIQKDGVERYAQNSLTPVTLSGVLMPWSQELDGSRTSDYKLVGPSGFEYSIVADSNWREVLSGYVWKEVKIIGLLNISNMTVIPQKIFPKGPNGENENVIDLVSGKTRELAKKLARNLTDLVLIPAAIYAVMAS